MMLKKQPPCQQKLMPAAATASSVVADPGAVGLVVATSAAASLEAASLEVAILEGVGPGAVKSEVADFGIAMTEVAEAVAVRAVMVMVVAATGSSA